MRSNDDWESLGSRRMERTPAVSPVRVALLFGSAAIALALMTTSYLEGGRYDIADAAPMGLDAIVTGSTGSNGLSGTYIIRRSVLQPSPDAVCIIRSNGTHSGHC